MVALNAVVILEWCPLWKIVRIGLYLEKLRWLAVGLGVVPKGRPQKMTPFHTLPCPHLINPPFADVRI